MFRSELDLTVVICQHGLHFPLHEKLLKCFFPIPVQVFRCVNHDCGQFYHPRCVVELLHSGNKTEGEKHEKNIAAGEPFACPLHKCYVCEELEVKSEPDLQFAICRCCPKAYHRKCLPA